MKNLILLSLLMTLIPSAHAARAGGGRGGFAAPQGPQLSPEDQALLNELAKTPEARSQALQLDDLNSEEDKVFAELAKRDLTAADVEAMLKGAEYKAKLEGAFKEAKNIVDSIPPNLRTSVLAGLLMTYRTDVIDLGAVKIPYSALLSIIQNINTHIKPESKASLGIKG